MGMGGGKGSGSSYTPPKVPALPVYQPPDPLPALPADPLADYNSQKNDEAIQHMKLDQENIQRKAKAGEGKPLLYTREERKSVEGAKGPFG